MANLDFIEKDLIDIFLNNGGYVLDFTNRTFQEFIYEKIQVDVYSLVSLVTMMKQLKHLQLVEQ